MIDQEAAVRIGYRPEDIARLHALAGGRFESVADIERVIDRLGYLYEWKANYVIQSVRASLHSAKITCVDSAILTYGLFDFFPSVKHRILAIHRRDQAGEECGHAVTLYWGADGKIGAFSKSSFEGFGHREPVYADEFSVATSFAQAYLKMGFEPLYFGVTTLEEAAGDLDWRFHPGELNVLSERLQAKYEFAFMLAR